MRRPAAALAVILASCALTAPTALGSSASAGECLALQVGGHRGMVYPKSQPTNENTLAAFDAAVAAGATVIESDIYHLSGTGGKNWVPTTLLHDATWDRTMSPASLSAAGVAAGQLATATTYAQRQQLRTLGGRLVPGFEQLAMWGDSHPATKIYLEVKSVFSVTEVSWFKSELAAYPGADVTFYSGLRSDVQPFGNAGMQIGIRYKSDWTQADYTSSGVSYVATNPYNITADQVAQVRQLAPGITIGGVGEATTAAFQQAVDLGFDVIIADSPALAVDWRANQCVSSDSTPSTHH